jgi:hypothetical protein
MAYSDYTSGVQRPRIQPRVPGQETAGMPGQAIGAAPAPAAPLPADNQGIPTDSAPPPATGRQQALQNVQQAYQGRMPGQMDALNAQLTGLAQPVGLNDPGLAPALRAGQMGDQRNFERQRSALAELLGAQGLGDSGAMNTQTLGIAQRIGEQGAARDAGLVYDEMGSRRNALLGALGMDQGRYQHDNQIGLQLSQLEALLNQQAMQPFV